MENAEATPRPWETEIGFGSPRVLAADEKGSFPVCDIRGWGHLTGKGHALGLPPDRAAGIQDANANLIVRAVNAHDVLVECLTDWLEYAEDNLSEFDIEECFADDETKLCPKCRSNGCLNQKINTTRAALLLASGAGQ